MGLKERYSESKTSSVILRLITRSLQFLLALVVAGIYGGLLEAQDVRKQAAASQWVYAEVVAGLSCITAVACLIPFMRPHFTFAVDWLLFVFWLAVFGVFGKMFLNRALKPQDAYKHTDTTYMKNGVWIDLINVFLWLITAIHGSIKFARSHKQRRLGIEAESA